MSAPSSALSLRDRLSRAVQYRRVEAPPMLAGSPAAGWETRWVWRFLLLGLIARAVRFFLNFPLWDDESFLCANFIDRGFLDLLRPLDHHQVAPPLFLWIELAMVRLLGFSETALRLFPFVCGIASLFLFRHLAGRLLQGTALVLAVAIFAVAYPGIRYAAEAKQYGPDLVVSLGLLTLAVEWWRRPDQARWLWALAALAPLAVGLSYPSVFVAGTVSLAVAVVLGVTPPHPQPLSPEAGARGEGLFPPPLRGRGVGVRGRGWVAWAVFNATLLAGCGVFFWLNVRNQCDAELAWMRDFWRNAFPPASLVKLPGWLLTTHAGDLLAYPVGGGRGASALTFVCWVLGLVVLVRRRYVMGLLLGLGPMALHLAAASLHRFPYGGHVKFSQYAAPLICCLAALGAASLLAWTGRRVRGPLPLYGALAALGLVAVVSVVRDVRHPYKTESDQRARDFARWFWFNAGFKGDIACARADFGQDFAPQAAGELTWEAMYRCNQRIYSPRHARAARLDLKGVSSGRPLRCVVYEDPRCGFDGQALAVWLEAMRARYELLGKDSFPFPRYDKREKKLITVDYLHVYQFVPRPGPVAAASRRLAGARR